MVDGFHIKEAGNFLSTIIGGRAVHPPNAVIGGFIKFPTDGELNEAIEKLKECRKGILRFLIFFTKTGQLLGYSEETQLTKAFLY